MSSRPVGKEDVHVSSPWDINIACGIKMLQYCPLYKPKKKIG